MKLNAIYGLQAVAAALLIAAGAAKLAGADIMVHPFEAVGLGAGFRLLAGTAEIVGGLLLLVPGAQLVGALMVSCVVVGAAGATIGHAARLAASTHMPQPGMVSTHQAIVTDRAGPGALPAMPARPRSAFIDL